MIRGWSRTGTHCRRRWLVLLGVLIAVVAAPVAAWAYWSGSGTLVRGPGLAVAATVNAGAVPGVHATGSTVTVSWGESQISNGLDVDGYVVRRYDAGSGIEGTVGAGCSGTIATLGCTETGVPTGSWRYTVMPVVATNWRGAESDRSGAVSVGSATLSLDQTLIGPPLPTIVTGSVSGFASGEAISYSVDGTTVSGSPTQVDASGNATITSLTIPDLDQGSHTVQITGASSRLVATAGIVIDTGPPSLSVSETPAPNAAGWNNTPVELSADVSDPDGGTADLIFTSDGSDPHTSPTAQVWDGQPYTVDQTTLFKYYAVDAVGNATPVQTLPVKIDTTPPSSDLFELTDVSGGAYLDRGTPTDPGAIYYRGVDPGSFRFELTPADDGGAPTVSLGASELTGVTTGFTDVPSVVTTPLGGPFLSNEISWVAGTTASPTGYLTFTDQADNTVKYPGSFINDSTPPSGGSLAVTGLAGAGGRYSSSMVLQLALDPGRDNGSGLGTGARLLRASAPLSSSGGTAGGVCGTYGPYTQVGAVDPATAVTDTVPADDACYRYEYLVPDNVGNVATYTTPDIMAQTAAPDSLTPASTTITPLDSPDSQSVSGTSVYYSPSRSGSFRVSTTVSDAVSGITRVSFPTLPGFSGGGTVAAPASGTTTYSTTYEWANEDPATPSPGPQTITASDGAGFSASTVGAFSVIADTGPSGGSVNVSGLGGTGGRYSTSTTIHLTLSKGTAGPSGFAPAGAELLRATAPLTSSGGIQDGVCGTYTGFSQIGGDDPPSTVTSTVPADGCYRYEYTVPDNVGTVATYTTPDVKVQSSAPRPLSPTAATITPVTGPGSQYVTGSTVYYNPAGSGSFTIYSSATDPEAGVTQVIFPAIPGFTGGGTVSTPNHGTTFAATYAWSANSASPSPGQQTVTAVDNAGIGASNASAFSVIADPGPTGGSVDATGLTGTGGRWSTTQTLHVALNKGTSPVGLAGSGAQLVRTSAPLNSDGTGTCGAYGPYTQIGADDPSSPLANTVPSDDTCYRYRYLVPDNVGTVATYTSPDIKVETTASVSLTPTTATIAPVTGASSQFVNGSTVFYTADASGSFTVQTSVIDVGGVAQVTFPAIPGFTGGGVVTAPTSGTTYAMTYSWSGNGTSPSPGALAISATNNAGATASNSNAFSVIADAAPVGGSVDATGLSGTGGRYSTSTTLHLVLNPGTDAGSGLASGAQLLRASAPLSSSDGIANGSCGSYGAYAHVGANDPTSPVTDTVPTDGTCYRYRYTVPDKAGNVTTYTSPDVKVQAAPATLAASSTLITPTTGLTSQSVSGNTTDYYAPAATGSFNVQVSITDTSSGVTQVTFPTIPGFTGGGVVTAPTSGTLYRTTYSWSNNGASPSPGPQTITATDNAGLSQTSTASFSVVKDTTGPVHNLSITAVTGAYLSAGKLYYNSNASGSFKFTDALSDSGSGPASVTYPALGQSGWAHSSSETVSTPSGGPFTSSVFSWSAHPNSPAGYTITGLDSLGNSTSTTITFVSDQSPPTGGSISYPTGLLTTASVPITTSNGTDAQSGVNAASAVIKRDEIPLNTSTDSCVGTFPGTYATTVTLVGGADTSVASGHCYLYRYYVSDYVGNQATYTPSSQNPVKVDLAPKVTAITSLQSGGGAGNGRLELGDQLVLTFSENLASASVPTTFAGATEARSGEGDTKLTIPGITNGALDTGSQGYLVGSSSKTATFAGTVALQNNGSATTVTVTVASVSGDQTASSSGNLAFAPATTITGTDGTLATGTFTATSFKLF